MARGSNGVLVERVTIKGQRAHAVEIVSALDSSGNMVSGVVGDLVDFGHILSVGNVHSDAMLSAKFSLAAAILKHYDELEQLRYFGAFNMPAELVEWAKGPGPINETKLAALVENGIITYQRDVDRQGHTPKVRLVLALTRRPTSIFWTLTFGT